MGRGVSSGGGQSSLGYLFGNKGEEAPKQGGVEKVEAAAPPPPVEIKSPATSKEPPVDVSKQVPAGIQSSTANNYFNGQNTCNFISDRPSTKIQAAPGGGSSLDYLFGGGGSN